MSKIILSLWSGDLVFTARSETIASTNYVLETQADYVAKAGIENALNWFRSTHYKPVGVANPTDPATDYQVTSDGSSYNLYTSNSNPVTSKVAMPARGSTCVDGRMFPSITVQRSTSLATQSPLW